MPNLKKITMDDKFKIEMAISMIRSARESVKYAFDSCEAAGLQTLEADRLELFNLLSGLEQAFQSELSRIHNDQHRSSNSPSPKP